MSSAVQLQRVVLDRVIFHTNCALEQIEASTPPGGLTTSWEVTGVIVEGGGGDWRAQRATFLFKRAAGEENFGLESRFP